MAPGDGPKDLSKPLEVDAILRQKRKRYVDAGWNSLPQGLLKFAKDHDKYVGCPIVGISIGPAEDETVLRK